MKLGVHLPFTGNPSALFEEAQRLELTHLEYLSFSVGPFAKMLKIPSVLKPEIHSFRNKASTLSIKTVTHATVIGNLASNNQFIANNTVTDILTEIQASGLLGVEKIVIHPGSAKGQQRNKALTNLAANISRLQKLTIKFNVALCIEMMVGAGDQLLAYVDEARKLLNMVPDLELCIDTAHANGAGYAIEPAFIDELTTMFSKKELTLWHLNDNQYPKGSKKERHAPIGQGVIGIDAFEYLMNEPRLDHCVGIVETQDNLLNDIQLLLSMKE